MVTQYSCPQQLSPYWVLVSAYYVLSPMCDKKAYILDVEK